MIDDLRILPRFWAVLLLQVWAVLFWLIAAVNLLIGLIGPMGVLRLVANAPVLQGGHGLLYLVVGILCWKASHEVR